MTLGLRKARLCLAFRRRVCVLSVPCFVLSLSCLGVLLQRALWALASVMLLLLPEALYLLPIDRNARIIVRVFSFLSGKRGPVPGRMRVPSNFPN
jgi:hypothetical protein